MANDIRFLQTNRDIQNRYSYSYKRNTDFQKAYSFEKKPNSQNEPDNPFTDEQDIIYPDIKEYIQIYRNYPFGKKLVCI